MVPKDKTDDKEKTDEWSVFRKSAKRLVVAEVVPRGRHRARVVVAEAVGLRGRHPVVAEVAEPVHPGQAEAAAPAHPGPARAPAEAGYLAGHPAVSPVAELADHLAA